jgi:hypothetical protein
MQSAELQRVLRKDGVTTELLDKFSLVDQVDGENTQGITIRNVYRGPLKFKGRNPKISEEVTHTFDCRTMTRTRNVRYIRCVSKYDPNKPAFKSTFVEREVFPLV